MVYRIKKDFWLIRNKGDQINLTSDRIILKTVKYVLNSITWTNRKYGNASALN